MSTLSHSYVHKFYNIVAYQDCAVGLLFALLPVLGGTSGVLQGVMSMTKSYVKIMKHILKCYSFPFYAYKIVNCMQFFSQGWSILRPGSVVPF